MTTITTATTMTKIIISQPKLRSEICDDDDNNNNNNNNKLDNQIPRVNWDQ